MDLNKRHESPTAFSQGSAFDLAVFKPCFWSQLCRLASVGVIALRDELLRRAVRQLVLDLRLIGIQLAPAQSQGSAELHSLGFPEAQGLLHLL